MITEPIASYYFRTSQRWVVSENEHLNEQHPKLDSLPPQNSQEESICLKSTQYSSFMIPRLKRMKN